MLCEHCSNIDCGQLTVGLLLLHHSSCLELVKSAEQGCELCWRFWDERRDFYRWHLTPQEYDEHQNTQLRLFAGHDRTPLGFGTLSICSDSKEFLSHLAIYADDCKYMWSSTNAYFSDEQKLHLQQKTTLSMVDR
jgi:hypothetical protein